MTPQNRPKYTGPSPAARTAGIGPQSCRQEMKHLASTGPSLGTSQHHRHWATIMPTKMVHLAGTVPTLGTETEPTQSHNHADT